MKMMNKTDPAAQGEITIYPKADADRACFFAGGTPLKVENGRLIVGHSETGHHHVIKAGGVDVMEMPAPSEGIRILRMIVADPDKKLEHDRSYDTHEAIGLPPGNYEIRIGREFDPYAQIARQQAD